MWNPARHDPLMAAGIPGMAGVVPDAGTVQLYWLLLVQGSIWVLGHCPGMCGPLIIGLRFPGIPAVIAYQAGKACTYGVLGAVAGLAGALVLRTLAGWGPLLVIGVALGIAVLGLRGLRRRGALEVAVPPWLAAPVRRWAGGRGGPFIFGASLAALPCGTALWVLGLAVASAHPLHGALLMAGLTVLNTPVLLAAHLLGRGAWFAGLRARWWWLPPVGLLLSAGWLTWTALHVGAPGCAT